MTSSLARLTTEAVNPASARIDELDAAGIVAVMNAEDAERANNKLRFISAVISGALKVGSRPKGELLAEHERFLAERG